MLVTGKGKAKSTQELITASVEALIGALESGHSEVLTSYLNAMARFHYYSFGNILLIATQKRDASHVAGMYAWSQLGRRVKRGEKGIMILAPMLGKKQRTDAHSENALSDAKTTETGKPEWNLIGFRPVYVWDVSQTEGKELPKFDEPQGDVSSQLPRLIEFVKQQGIKLDYSDKIAPAKGISYGGAIRLLPNMAPAEEFATLVHEVAHEMIHKAERRNLRMPDDLVAGQHRAAGNAGGRQELEPFRGRAGHQRRLGQLQPRVDILLPQRRRFEPLVFHPFQTADDARQAGPLPVGQRRHCHVPVGGLVDQVECGRRLLPRRLVADKGLSAHIGRPHEGEHGFHHRQPHMLALAGALAREQRSGDRLRRGNGGQFVGQNGAQ